MAGKSLSESMASAAERIQEIVDAAERIAADIRTEAETEAEEYLEQRRRDADQLTVERSRELQEISATLADHATRVKEQAEDLVRSVDAAVAKMTAAPPEVKDVPPLAAAPDPESDAADVPPAGAPRPTAYAGKGGNSENPSGTREDALVRATQMAVAGHERAEIEAALASEFGIEEPGPLVDDILGAEAS
jgi:hypothetical protein